MSISFTPELGTQILHKIHSRNWKVIYENRNHGHPDGFQPIDEIFSQVANELTVEPRYHIYPASISFETFIHGVINDSIQIPRVTIDNEKRIVFGFGIRQEHCYFVTNATIAVGSADREPKQYQYMLDALDTLESFSIKNRP